MKRDQQIFDIISNAVPNYGTAEGNAEAIETSTRARIMVISTVRDDGERFDYQVALFFIKDANGDWRFDFLQSVENLRREMERAKAPPVEDVTLHPPSVTGPGYFPERAT